MEMQSVKTRDRGFSVWHLAHGLAAFLLTLATVTQAQVVPGKPSFYSSVQQRTLARALSPRPVVTPEQTATQLSDGHWLLVGGVDNPAQLLLLDSPVGQPSALPMHLNTPRSGHSATLLPDGTVLIYGGVNAVGAVLSTTEQYDPTTGSVTALGSIGLLPRAYHTATVLADGRVLVAGGVGHDNQPLLDAELYNPESGDVEYFDAKLDRARLKDIAALAPNASVLLWGGVDTKGQALTEGSLYDPATTRFSAVGADTAQAIGQTLANTASPAVLESRPASNATNISVSERLMVRFSKRMAAASLNTNTVTLIGPNSVTAIKPVPVEGGVLLFVTPAQELLPNSSYTLFINGATDEAGQLLPFTAIGFTTAALGTTDTSGASGSKTGTTTASTTNGASSTGTSASSNSRSTSEIPVGIRAAALVPAWQAASIARILAAIQAAMPTRESMIAEAEASDDSELWIPDAANYHGQWTSGRRALARQYQPGNDVVKRALYGHPEIIAALSKLTPATVASGALTKLVSKGVLNAPKGVTAIAGQVLRLNGKPLANVTLSMGNRQVETDLNGEFLLERIPAGHQILVIEGGSADLGKRKYGRYEYGLNVVANQTNALPFVIWMTRLDSQDEVTISSPTTGKTILTNPQIPGLELRIPAGTVIRDAHGKIVTQISMTAIPTDQPPFPLPNFPVPVYFTVQPGGSHLEGAAGQVSKGAQLIYPNFTHSSPGTRIAFWDYDATSKGWYEYGQGTVTADGTQVMPDPGVVIYEFSGAMVSLPTNAPNGGPPPGGCQSADPVDCFTGLFINDEADLVIKDVIPIEVRRTYRQLDNTSRGFGIGTNLSYDFFIVGTSHGTTSSGGTYTYQDLILPDGAHIHYPRISPGTSFSDAVYQSTSTPGPYYGSIIKWDVGGTSAWKLTLKNGTIYTFGDSDSSPNARYAAVRSIVDRHGNALTLTRDGNSNLTQITSPNGRHLNFVYDSSNRVTTASDDAGRAVNYVYDTAGRLITVTDPAGNTEHYTYDSSNNMLTVTDKRSNMKVTNTYDANNRVATQSYPDGTNCLFQYTLDSTGTVVTQTKYTDPRGIVKSIAFGANGYPTSVTTALGRPEQQTITNNWNVATGLISSVTDPLNRTTAYSYDTLGNVTQITQLSGTANAVTTSTQYDPTFSRPTQLTDANGLITSFTYDGAGNLQQARDPLGHIKNFTYDTQGRLLTATDANGNTASFMYFGADLATVTDALGRKMFISTDVIGRVTSITNLLGGQSTNVYDALARLTSSTDPNGSQIQFGYDPNGNRTSHIDANTHATTYTFDTLNRVLTKADALSHGESYGYDPAGNLVKRIDRK